MTTTTAGNGKITVKDLTVKDLTVKDLTVTGLTGETFVLAGSRARTERTITRTGRRRSPATTRNQDAR